MYLSFLPEIKEISILYFLGVNMGSHTEIPLGKTFWKHLVFHSAEFLLGHIISVPAEWDSKDSSQFHWFCLYLMLVYIGHCMGNQLLFSIYPDKRVVVSQHSVKTCLNILVFSFILPFSHFAIHSKHVLFLLYL